MTSEEVERCRKLVKDLNAYFLKAKQEQGCDIALSTIASMQATAIVAASAIACITDAEARKQGIKIASREFNSALTRAVEEGRKELDRLEISQKTSWKAGGWNA